MEMMSAVSGLFKLLLMLNALCICSMSYVFYMCLIYLAPLESSVLFCLAVSVHLFRHTQAPLCSNLFIYSKHILCFIRSIYFLLYHNCIIAHYGDKDD